MKLEKLLLIMSFQIETIKSINTKKFFIKNDH